MSSGGSGLLDLLVSPSFRLMLQEGLATRPPALASELGPRDITEEAQGTGFVTASSWDLSTRFAEPRAGRMLVGAGRVS